MRRLYFHFHILGDNFTTFIKSPAHYKSGTLDKILSLFQSLNLRLQKVEAGGLRMKK